MKNTPNWGMLYAKGRCKAIGIFWSDEDLHALHELHIPVEFIRNGCVTLEAYEKAKQEVEEHKEKTGEAPLEYKSEDELKKSLESDVATVTADASTSELRDAVRAKKKKEKTKEEDLEKQLEEELNLDTVGMPATDEGGGEMPSDEK